MAGVEDVVVQWAPTVAPLAEPVDPDEWVTLPHWQTIKTVGGQTIDDVTQTFNVGKATIRVRNGDHAAGTPTFLPTTSYKGRHIRVKHPIITNPWRGRIGRVEFHYENTPFAGFVTLHCVDILGQVADGEIPDELFPGTVDYFTQVDGIVDAVERILLQVGIGLAPVGEFSRQLVKAPDKFETRQSLFDFLNQALLTEGAALYATPDGDLQLRGRWRPLALLAADAQPPIVFTDTNPNPDPLAVDASFGYRRDDLEWSDADEGFVNSVQTRSKYLATTVVEEDVPADYPKIQLSRTELVTIRQGWVEANARMWLTLYNQARAYPKKIKFMVGSRGVDLQTVFSIAPAASWPLFDFQFQVLHTPPGSTQITYRLAVDYVEHDIDRQRWLCTLGFESLDRWWFGYGNGTDPIELIEIDGDAGHGIDSDAIIAP